MTRDYVRWQRWSLYCGRIRQRNTVKPVRSDRMIFSHAGVGVQCILFERKKTRSKHCECSYWQNRSNHSLVTLNLFRLTTTRILDTFNRHKCEYMYIKQLSYKHILVHTILLAYALIY